MEYLLDTHAFLWFISGDSELSDKAKSHILNPEITKYISTASFWEIAIKVSLKKLALDMPFNELKDHVFQNGFTILPITFEHTANLLQLEQHHKDPFDRLIIAQALTDQLAIISRDSQFSKYNVHLIW